MVLDILTCLQPGEDVKSGNRGKKAGSDIV